jgi:hypothetical protein
MVDITNIDCAYIDKTYEQDTRKVRDWFGNEGYIYYNGRYRLKIVESKTKLEISKCYQYEDLVYALINISSDGLSNDYTYELMSFTPII